VSRFLQNAARILEAAESVSGSQASLYPEMTISIGPEGGIRIATQGTGEPLDVVQQQHGAQMVYRVTQQESRVRLEGRAGFRTCLFEAERPDGAARILLGGAPRYSLSLEPVLLPVPTTSQRPHFDGDTATSRSWTA
jgi:hypothetical protein